MRLKKTKRKSRRSGRGDPESDGDHRGYERKNGDVRCPHWPGHESSFVDLGPVAEAEEGESSLPQSPGAQEGGAVRSLHFGVGDPVAEPWSQAKWRGDKAVRTVSREPFAAGAFADGWAGEAGSGCRSAEESAAGRVVSAGGGVGYGWNRI